MALQTKTLTTITATSSVYMYIVWIIQIIGRQVGRDKSEQEQLNTIFCGLFIGEKCNKFSPFRDLPSSGYWLYSHLNKNSVQKENSGYGVGLGIKRSLCYMRVIHLNKNPV